MNSKLIDVITGEPIDISGEKPIYCCFNCNTPISNYKGSGLCDLCLEMQKISVYDYSKTDKFGNLL